MRGFLLVKDYSEALQDNGIRPMSRLGVKWSPVHRRSLPTMPGLAITAVHRTAKGVRIFVTGIKPRQHREPDDGPIRVGGSKAVRGRTLGVSCALCRSVACVATNPVSRRCAAPEGIDDGIGASGPTSGPI